MYFFKIEEILSVLTNSLNVNEKFEMLYPLFIEFEILYIIRLLIEL